MEMTHRERIVEAINHRPTDVLPIDFGAMRSTGISILAYDKLRHYLKLDNGLPKMYDVFQQLAEPETAVLDRLGGDVVQAHRLCPAFELSIKQWKETTLPGGVRCMVPAGYNPVSYTHLTRDPVCIRRQYFGSRGGHVRIRKVF